VRTKAVLSENGDEMAAPGYSLAEQCLGPG